MFKALVCTVVAGLVAVVSANEFHSQHVVDLKGDFTEKVNDGGVWLVKFYAPWCGHCKKLAPAWGQLGERFTDNPKINVAHIDCTQQKETCSEFGVKGYPTLKAIVGGKEFKPYKGGRDLESLTTFLKETAAEALGETTA